MNQILVDSSVWIDFFKGSENINSEFFHECIDNNLICINDLILAELVPFLEHKKEFEVIDILKSVNRIPLVIDWDEIIQYQSLNLKKGVNRVGIPDLILLQNAVNNNLKLYTLDRHFKLMKKFIGIDLV